MSRRLRTYGLACIAVLVVAAGTPAAASALPAAGAGAGSSYCGEEGNANSEYSYRSVFACATTHSKGATPFDSDGNESFQCVELSARFLWAIYGIWAGPGSGVETGADLVGVVHSKHPEVSVSAPGPGSVPLAGDVISFGPGGGSDATSGHTAVVISSNVASGQFTVMSENDPDGHAGEQTVEVDLAGKHNGSVKFNGLWTTASWLDLASSEPPPPPPNHPLSDFNGDGLSDIAWYSNGNVVGLLSEGGHAFKHWEALAGPLVGQSELGPPVWAGVGDFNGDGIADIAWYSNGNIVGLLSEGGHAFKHWEALAGPLVGQSELGPPEWAGVGDFNGDGISDIAWYSNGNIVGLLSESGRALKHWEYLAGPMVGQGELGPPEWAGVGDFNGDGISDIAWYSNGNIVGLLSEGGRAFKHWEALAGPLVGQSELGPPEWAGVGDFNGDGISDIAWYSNGNIVGLLSESGRALKHWEYLAGPMVGQGELGPPEWAGVGNYNGDGISDIAWYSNGNIVGLLSESGRALKHWEYLAGPVVGQSELGPPEWAGQGDFPYTNGGNARRVDFIASSPSAATLGQSYSYTFAASGTPAPTFSIASGALPPGTTLSRNGVLSGTPTKVGSYQVSVKAANSAIGPGTFTGTLTLVVATTPTVAKVNPRKAGPEGGVSVQITGTGFATGAIVKFGATVASSITVNSSTSITAVAPPGTSGPVEVSVTSQGGTSKLSTKDRFTYGPPVVASVSADHGSKAGGTRVTIEGSGFSTSGTSFTFGKASGTAIECASTGSCSVVVPAAAKAGVVDVVAVVGKSKSKKNRPVDQYVYE